MNNPFPMPEEAKRRLLRYFFDMLDDAMSSAGCNDIEQSVFHGLTQDERMELYAGYLKYDHVANPEDWEPRKFEHIPDFSWLAYLRSRMEE